MRYRNYNNTPNFFWLIFIIFLFMGGFRIIFLLLPVVIGILVYFLPFIIFGIFVFSILKRIILNQKINTNLNQSTIDHSKFVDILINILVHAIKADGKIDTREIQVIKNFFRANMKYSSVQMMWIDDLIKNALNRFQPLEGICSEFANSFNYESRLILLELVFQIVYADGFMSVQEREFIKKIVSLLSIQKPDYERIAFAYTKEDKHDQYYNILGLKQGSSKEEIKKAYKNASKKYHPDKVYHLGEEFRNVAEEKMRDINKAYKHLMQTT